MYRKKKWQQEQQRRNRSVFILISCLNKSIQRYNYLKELSILYENTAPVKTGAVFFGYKSSHNKACRKSEKFRC